MGGYKKRISRIVMVALLFVFLVGNSNMVHAMGATQVGYASKYITVKGNNMHLALYGKLDASGETFADEGKTTLVMMPALGVPSPHIYFKPLAQSLDESFNIVIVEPFGYGLSDVAATDRTVDNINSELNAALDTMGIKQCVLLVHSISGVYGLNFVQNSLPLIIQYMMKNWQRLWKWKRNICCRALMNFRKSRILFLLWKNSRWH